jgi:hypothetical protein
MAGEKGQYTVFNETRFHIGSEIIGQERRQIALQRRYLFDTGAQREKLAGAAEHFRQRLRLAWIEAWRGP